MNVSKSGKIYLIPNVISEETENKVIPPAVLSIIQDIRYYLAEDIRSGRRFLSKLMKLLPENRRHKIESLEFELLDKRTSYEEAVELIRPVKKGMDCGVISESGCPGIADPGSLVVKAAHRSGIQVVPLTGPSSILLALMGSGMNGQSFTFHGYLPIDKKKLTRKIKKLETLSERNYQTQIFIETPYRNQKLFETLLGVCAPHTRLCVASGLTGSEAFIRTREISEWKNHKIQLKKTPAVFLIET
ncbi:MAG: SAM-dependent methyltransferase [Bacteroidetes bacterium]|nr:SAM-dependent methyltransferase [Bacteroidota bacterium]